MSCMGKSMKKQLLSGKRKELFGGFFTQVAHVQESHLFFFFFVKIHIKTIHLFCGFFEEAKRLSELEQGVCALPPFCDIFNKMAKFFFKVSKEKGE